MKGYILDWNRSMIANELLFSKSHVKYHGLVIVKTSKRTDIIVLFLLIIVLYGSHCHFLSLIEQFSLEYSIFLFFHLMWHSNVNSKRRHWSNNDKKETSQGNYTNFIIDCTVRKLLSCCCPYWESCHRNVSICLFLFHEIIDGSEPVRPMKRYILDFITSIASYKLLFSLSPVKYQGIVVQT